MSLDRTAEIRARLEKRQAGLVYDTPVDVADISYLLTELETLRAALANPRNRICNCPLPYRAIVPETHEESCPVVNDPALAASEAREKELREALKGSLDILTGWTTAIQETGTGWDDWDYWYKEAAYNGNLEAWRAVLNPKQGEG